MKKQLKQALVLALGAVLLVCGTACAKQPEPPVELTLWHVYGGQTDSPLNALIQRFNRTEGKEQNIYVRVTSVSNTNTIHEAVLAAANRDPGAPALPDLFVSYPKTVLALPDDSILVDYRDYFTPEELEAYLPPLLAEGEVNGRLVVFPTAKSTEMLFVNRTAFDRYAAQTGDRVEELQTWEGLFRMAEDYTRWSDAQTPEVPGDGKAMLVHDYHFNYFQVGAASLGEDFFADGALALGPAFERAWAPYARAALTGGMWLQNGYATEPLRTGDAIVSVASSASVLYYTNTVTYPDNTSEQIQMEALPCPVFEDGEKQVMLRGGGLCTVRSTPQREQAAAAFIKWLTSPEVNVEFVTSLGYMPVTREAFEQYLPEAIRTMDDPVYRSLYRTFARMQEEYHFYTPPQLENYLDLESGFEHNMRLQLSAGRHLWQEALRDGTADEARLACLLEETRAAVQQSMTR